MRFNVLGFDQLKATELGLNLDELMLLRHLQDFTNSGKMDTVIHNGKMYYWVKYDKFVDDLPILNMKKTRVMEIFNNNLCVKPKDWEDRYNSMSESSKKRAKSFKFIGVLESYTKKDAEGTKSYFTFTKLFYSLMPNITNNDADMGNKKASTVPPVKAEDLKNNDFNNIIPQNNSNDTKKEEDLEIINLIKESCINVKKVDLIKYKDEFADINRFKEAIAICESRNSHGIKALRLAYKYGDNDNKKDNKKQSTIFMADSQVDINGKLKSVTEMTDKEIEEKINQKWGWTF